MYPCWLLLVGRSQVKRPQQYYTEYNRVRNKYKIEGDVDDNILNSCLARVGRRLSSGFVCSSLQTSRLVSSSRFGSHVYFTVPMRPMSVRSMSCHGVAIVTAVKVLQKHVLTSGNQTASGNQMASGNTASGNQRVRT